MTCACVCVRQLVVGRSPTLSTLIIPDPLISRQHVRFDRRPDGTWTITDLVRAVTACRLTQPSLTGRHTDWCRLHALYTGCRKSGVELGCHTFQLGIC